jgi:uncharacterized protein YlxP (DUF503 family)
LIKALKRASQRIFRRVFNRINFKPGILQWLGDGTRVDERDVQRRVEIGIIGVANDKRDALFIRRERGDGH